MCVFVLTADCETDCDLSSSGLQDSLETTPPPTAVPALRFASVSRSPSRVRSTNITTHTQQVNTNKTDIVNHIWKF